MHGELTRRYLLGVSGALALGGCLEAGGTSGSDDEEPNSSEEPTDGDETDETTPEEPEEGDESDDSDEEGDGREEGDDEIHAAYETTEVRVVSAEGDELGAVTAAIADTYDLRRLGLSDTDELPEDRGMLFVFESVDDHTFVMREMDFSIDIVYADADGVITAIHHAEQPEPGESGEEPEHQYPGRGQYVLEVNYEWIAERGVSEGDRLEFDLESESEADG